MSGVVGEEVHNRVADAELLLPGLGREGVVDGDDVDALDALLRELVGALGVAGDLGAARGSEGAGDADDDVWDALGQSGGRGREGMGNHIVLLPCRVARSTVPFSGLSSFRAPLRDC